MKKKQRKSYTAAFKVKIALEAVKGQRTINEIATHYGVHPNMAIFAHRPEKVKVRECDFAFSSYGTK